MTRYALYVWSAYAISLAALTATVLVVVGGYIRTKRRIQNLAKNSD